MKLSAEIHNALDDCQRYGEAYYPSDHNVRRTLKRHARANSEEICNPYRHLFARTSWWNSLNPIQRAEIVIVTMSRHHPNWIFCGISAAILLGLCDSYYLLDNRIHIVTTTASNQGSDKWISRHYLDAASVEHVTFARRVAVTPVERTVFDCARSLPFHYSLGLIDAALRLGYTKEELLRYCSEHKYYRHSRAALIAISYGDGLSENGGESFARSQMIALGYEPPQLQVNFWDALKGRNSRVDYLWKVPPAKLIVFELHGKQKYLDPQMTDGRSINQLLSAERKRASRLSLHGAVVNDIDIRDCYHPAELDRQLDAYGVPKRASAPPGQIEYNRQAPLIGKRYPPPIVGTRV